MEAEYEFYGRIKFDTRGGSSEVGRFKAFALCSGHLRLVLHGPESAEAAHYQRATNPYGQLGLMQVEIRGRENIGRSAGAGLEAARVLRRFDTPLDIPDYDTPSEKAIRMALEEVGVPIEVL